MEARGVINVVSLYCTSSRTIMKKFSAQAVFSILALVGIWGIPSAVFAVTSLAKNLMLVLPGDKSHYTLTAGSSFSSMNIGLNTFTITLDGGNSVTLISPDKRQLNNSLNSTIFCESDHSAVTVSLPSGSAPQQVTITPGGVCGASSGGEGWAGPSTASASSQAASGHFFSQSLFSGSQGQDVHMLQKILIAQGLLSLKSTTGFFGPITQQAVQQFQKKYGIVSSGTSATTGYGSVGPKTRAKLNEISGGTPSSGKEELIKQLQKQILLLQAQLLQVQQLQNK